MRPSGAQTIDHGTSMLATTVSTRKLTWSFDCPDPFVATVVSISPAPRPGGACPQAGASNVSQRKIGNRGEAEREKGKGERVKGKTVQDARLDFANMALTEKVLRLPFTLSPIPFPLFPFPSARCIHAE